MSNSDDTTTATKYTASWIEGERTEREGHDWAQSADAERAISLGEARELAQAHGLKAKLYDDRGSLRWWVFPDGGFQTA